MAWLHPPALGCRYSFLHLPCARCGHSMCVYSESLVLFGGFDGKKWLNDLHLLNTSIMVWEQPKVCGISPSPRQYHAAVMAGDIMYIYGGFSGSFWLRDMHSLDFKSMKWVQINSPTMLPAKEGHTLEVVGEMLYCFGGWDGTAVSDLHTFDLRTHLWQLVELPEPRPARCGHSMTCVNGVLYVYGGFDGESWGNTLFTLDTKQARPVWNKPVSQGYCTPRGYHSAVQVNQYILMFGGYNGQFILGDVAALDTVTLTWSIPDPCFGRFPMARNAHTLSLVGSELYLFGGYNGTRDIDNLDVLETAAFSTLREDMRILMSQGRWKDIVLVGENGHVEAHAVVLKARAPLLYARASPSGEIRIGQCSQALLMLFLEYLYCDLGKDKIAPFLDQFLEIAVNYDIENLRLLCTAAIHDSTLTTELAQIINFQELSDLVLVAEGVEFPVHKVIMCVRCPFFKAMFESGMRESQSARVELPDVTAEALRYVIEWVYSDKFDPLVNEKTMETAIAVQLLSASNRLALQSLMRMTEIVLQQQLTPDNVVPLFEVAFILNAQRLKSYCLNLILRDFDRVSMKR